MRETTQYVPYLKVAHGAIRTRQGLLPWLCKHLKDACRLSCVRLACFDCEVHSFIAKATAGVLDEIAGRGEVVRVEVPYDTAGLDLASSAGFARTPRSHASLHDMHGILST